MGNSLAVVHLFAGVISASCFNTIIVTQRPGNVLKAANDAHRSIIPALKYMFSFVQVESSPLPCPPGKRGSNRGCTCVLPLHSVPRRRQIHTQHSTCPKREKRAGEEGGAILKKINCERYTLHRNARQSLLSVCGWTLWASSAVLSFEQRVSTRSFRLHIHGNR